MTFRKTAIYSPICQFRLIFPRYYKISSFSMTGKRRSIVSFTMASFPVTFKNCFGIFLLLNGQNLVPLPPAIIIPYRFILYLSPLHPCTFYIFPEPVVGKFYSSSNSTLCVQPIPCSFDTSVSFLGVPSGISLFQTISPSYPTVFFTSPARSAIVSSFPFRY